MCGTLTASVHCSGICAAMTVPGFCVAIDRQHEGYVPELRPSRIRPAAARINTIACTLWLAGCVASSQPAPKDATAAQPQADSQTAAPGGPAPPASAPAAPASAPPAPPASATPAVQPKPATVVAAPATGSKKVKSKPPPADATMHPNPVVAAASAAQAPATSAPTLDLAALKQRLRDTRAIGVFTKLALKNQVDDLLDKFRGFYGGQLKTTLPELRQLYELLVQKVLALLQDSDPPLAKEIVASREAIWGLLADPQKFATL
jgi:hypothetical protein